VVKVLQVGDKIEPTDEAEEIYGVTCKPTMTEGVVLKVLERGRIRIEITEGEEADDYRGTDFDVEAKYFTLLAPLTKDGAFEKLVQGHINDDEYIQMLKKIEQNT
jgi:hypothetical protein